MEILVQFQHMLEIFFAVLDGASRHVELVVQSDIILFLVIILILVKSADDPRIVDHFFLKKTLVEGLRVFEIIDGAVQQVDLIRLGDVVLLIVDFPHEIFA